MSSQAVERPNTTGPGKGLRVVIAVVAAALQLVVGFFTVTAIGLVSVPLWASAILIVAWLVAAALVIRSVRRSPLVAVLVPVVNGLLLWGLIAVGEVGLGWMG